MYVSKWYTFTACAYLQLASGICYSFSIYSPAIKDVFELDQPQLEGLASSLLSGGYVAWLPGLLYNALQAHNKLAPRLVAGMGVGLHTLGYGLIWLAATERVQLPYWALIGAGLCGSAAIVFMDAACVVTCLRNFSRERGNVVGVLKSFLGLAASLAATIYAGGFPHGREGQLAFLGFLTLLPAAVAIPALPLLNHVPYLERCETSEGPRSLSTGGRFGAAYVVLVALMAYQLGSALAKGLSPDPWSPGTLFLNMCGALALAAAPLLLPLGTGGLRSVAAFPLPPAGPVPEDWEADSAAQGPHLDDSTAGSEPLLPGRADDAHRYPEKGAWGTGRPQGGPPQLTLGECLVSLDFWMLFGVLMVGLGSGFALLNNLGQMVSTREGPPASRTTLVLLFTTLNCIGRMALGFLSEKALHQYGLPRTFFLIATSAGLALSSLGVAFASVATLYPSCMLSGLCFGFYWGLFPVLTSELFGLQNFASNQSIVHLAPTLGGLLLSTFLAGPMYERRRHAQHPCLGVACFRDTFLVIAGLAAVGTAVSYVLHVRNCHIYKVLARDVKEYDHEADS
eukprot:jgi/Botrbrau1/16233/Bobra.0066s0019.1